MCLIILCRCWWLSSIRDRYISVISSQDMPFLYALTYGGYAFAASSPIERAIPTRAASRYARSSAAVIGRRSVSVPGFGIDILDI